MPSTRTVITVGMLLLSAPTQAADCWMTINGKRIRCFAPEAETAIREIKQKDVVIELKDASHTEINSLAKHLNEISK